MVKSITCALERVATCKTERLSTKLKARVRRNIEALPSTIDKGLRERALAAWQDPQ